MKNHAAPLLIVVAAAFFVFGPSMGHDFLLNWDDPPYVTKNPVVSALTWENIRAAFTSFFVGNYAPLHILSYMLDHALWGMNPAGFIFGNIVCHAVNSMLLYVILLHFSLSRCAATFAALLFMLHPVQVESVVWISQRKNVLAMCFYLLAFLMYLLWRQKTGKSSVAAYVISLTAFAAALLVKSVTVILPLTLVVHDFCIADDRRAVKIIPDKLPYLLIAMAGGCLALLSQSAEFGGGGRTGYHGGSPLATVYSMLPVFVSYLRMVVWPAGLSVVYAPAIKSSIDGEVAAAALLLAVLAAGGAWLYRRNRRLFFWIAVIPIGLLPVSQIIPLVTLMNDRYLYFPMLGIAACCGFLCDQVMTKTAAGWRPVAITAGVVILVVFAALSLQRARVWQNSDLLWQDATQKQPKSAVAWHTLGETYEKRGKFAAAISAEERARTLCNGVECRLVIRKLSELYLREGLLDQAGASISELLSLYPEAADGYALSGHLSYQQGELAKSEAAYLKALRIDARMVSAITALGNVYLATGRAALAMEKFETAASLQRPTAELVYSMACAAALMGDRLQALELLDEALRLGYNRPDLLLHNPELNLVKGEKEFLILLERYFPNR